MEAGAADGGTSLLCLAILAFSRGVSAGGVESRAAFDRGSSRRPHSGGGPAAFRACVPPRHRAVEPAAAGIAFSRGRGAGLRNHLSVFSALSRQLNSTSLPEASAEGN